MKTSIIVPCYGGYAQYLPACIDSLLKQTVPVEIIIATDGRTPAIRKMFDDSVKIVVKHSQSQPVLINFGFRFAKGKYFLDMGCDDLLEPTYIEEAEKILEENPGYDVYLPVYRKFGGADGLWIADGMSRDMLFGNTMLMGSVMKRTLWESLGGFDEKIPHDAYYDWEFWIRAYKAGAVVYKGDKPLYKYHMKTGGTAEWFPNYGTQFLDYAKAKGTL